MRVSTALLVVLSAAASVRGSAQTFRSTSDAVFVDVSVTRDGQPVMDLDAGAFALTDDGVQQGPLDVVREQLPLDLRVSLDVSGSLTAPQRASLEAAAQAVKAALRPDDTITVTLFGSHIAAAPADEEPLRIPDAQPRRGTSLRDALLLALAAPAPAGRRQLTIVMSDGDDSASFYDAGTVRDTARFAAGPVWVVLVGGSPRRLRPQDELLESVAALTGGSVLRIGSSTEAAAAFSGVLAGFRASYVLRYVPRDVADDGWHELGVSVQGRGLQVRARKGYWRGPPARTGRSFSAGVMRARVAARFPHDSSAFTQGLAFDAGLLYESTGRYGRSLVRTSDLATGRTIAQTALDRHFFGEGLTVLGDRVVQLTWREHRGFVYDRQLRLEREFTYEGEAWGLAHDGTHLIVSDGSATLRYVEPVTFREVGA